MVNPNDWLKLVAAIMVCELVGILGGLFTFSAIPEWYAGLNKPSFVPPSWVFAPVWTILYALMGIALFLVWKKGFEKKEVRFAIGVFSLQLALNFLWSFLFFGMKNLGLAFVEIVLLWLAICWTIWEFKKVSQKAVWLLLPFWIWVSFAALLNFAVWQLN